MHHEFDVFNISINPDDNYKVIAFSPVGGNIEGRCLDPELFAPVDQVLRWHFRCYGSYKTSG